MATQRLFLGTNSVVRKRVGNAMSTEYSYFPDEKILDVYWKGELVSRKKAYPGQVWVICCNGVVPEVNEIGIPYHKEDLIAWLLSYFKQSRAYSIEEYMRLVKRRKKSFHWFGYKEWEIIGKNYRIAFCNSPYGSELYRLACYINPDISKVELIELFNRFNRSFCYPKSFVREILKKKLNFIEEELNQIKAL